MNEQELMLTSVLDCSRTDLYANPVGLSALQLNQLKEMKARRASDEPLQYILGECVFAGLKFKVDSRVLIPRQETEILVDVLLQRTKGSSKKHLRILDLGTGCGNIAISLAKYIDDCFVTAVDISRDALGVARENARINNTNEKIEFVHSDMVEFLSEDTSRKASFDIIVSNPPYIAESQMVSLPGDVKQEPEIALNGGEDGLKFYRSIIPSGSLLLKRGGLLVLEIGDGQHQAVKCLIEGENKFSSPNFYKDFSGVERVVIASLS
jgi:release factor glutamine methyltransferase